MIVRSGQAFAVEFITSNPTTGAAANADSTPAAVVVVNGVDAATVVTVSNVDTGRYKAAGTFGTIPAGAVVELAASATVAGVAGKGIVFRGTTGLLVDASGRAAADVAAWEGEDVPFSTATQLAEAVRDVSNASPASGSLGAAVNAGAASAVWGYSLTSLAALATTTVGRWLYDKVTAVRAAIGATTIVRQPADADSNEIELRKSDDYNATTGQWIEFDATGWPEFASGGVKLRISQDGTLIGSEHECSTSVVDADTQTVICYLSRADLAELPYGAVADYRVEATWSTTNKATIRHGKINVVKVGA